MRAAFSAASRRTFLRHWLITLLACSLAGCASRPPLPKRAALETARASGSATDFRETVASADIIYFPSERAASGARSEPAALLLEALEGGGMPFAIAWDLIDASQQSVLDQLPTEPPRERGEVVARIELAGHGRAREHCRSVLNDPRLTVVRQIALRPPNRSLAPAAEPPTGMRFKLPAGGMEAFAEGMTAAESLSGRDVAAAYHARVAQQQFAAEQIVRHFQSGAPGKLLVFLRASDLANGQGVPFYVAQKLPLRQVVLGPNSEHAPAKLLTLVGDRRLQIVDRSPFSGRD